MSRHLVPSTSDLFTARTRLAELRTQLAAREQEFTALQDELRALQAGYFEKVGGLYAELIELSAAVIEAEIRVGLRTPPEDDPEEAEDSSAEDPLASLSPDSTAPSNDLKLMFRNLAKAIHPDLAVDDAARFRRHSLMAEANRAYAERDEDRLRLIMRAWERAPDFVPEDGSGDERQRVSRQIGDAEARLAEFDARFADLRRAAIYRLKTKIDAARRQGWDLFAEMILQVKRELSTAKTRLASLRRARAT